MRQIANDIPVSLIAAAEAYFILTLRDRGLSLVNRVIPTCTSRELLEWQSYWLDRRGRN
jgi:hypothetical protein